MRKRRANNRAVERVDRPSAFHDVRRRAKRNRVIVACTRRRGVAVDGHLLSAALYNRGWTEDGHRRIFAGRRGCPTKGPLQPPSLGAIRAGWRLEVALGPIHRRHGGEVALPAQRPKL